MEYLVIFVIDVAVPWQFNGRYIYTPEYVALPWDKPIMHGVSSYHCAHGYV